MENLKESKDVLQKSNASFKFGLIGGLIITAILFLIQLADGGSPYLSITGLFAFAIVLIYSLNRFWSSDKENTFFNAIGFGIKTSLIAALTVVIINVVLYFINAEISFTKYAIEPESLMKLFAISGIILFEIFVFGTLISFITLQYLKNPK